MNTATIEPPLADPFHDGECALQERTGVRARMAVAGPRMIRDHMPEQHRELFDKLPFVLLGHLDAQGRPQASVLAGPPGFMHGEDAHHLRIAAQPPRPLPSGSSIGLLGIEPHTRRRNRMNGTVVASDPQGFTVRVVQSFGNCPKYIQARPARWSGIRSATASPSWPSEGGATLDAAAHALVADADTFFIASSCPPDQVGRTPAHGVDVSHRGGRPGFVRVSVGADGARLLTVPDFTGNSSFNTLGNLAIHPRAGLLFVDFATGTRLQVEASAEIVWDGAELASFKGALRLVRFTVSGHRVDRSPLGLEFGAAEWAEQLHATGRWPA